MLEAMKRLLLVSASLLLILFVGIQFFQPDKNISAPTQDDIFKQLDVPEEIQSQLIISCFDCHSNNTKYPWYSQVAPVSWLMNKHVVEGKKALNFSEWGTLNKRKQISALSGVAEETEEGSMPLNSYLKMHKNAVLTDKTTKQIISWTDEAIEQIMDK